MTGASWIQKVVRLKQSVRLKRTKKNSNLKKKEALKSPMTNSLIPTMR